MAESKPKERRVNSRGGGKITQVYVNGRWMEKSLYLKNRKMWDRASTKNNQQKGNTKSKTNGKGKGITVKLEGGGTHTIYPGHKDYEDVKSGKKQISTNPSDHVSEAKTKPKEKLKIDNSGGATIDKEGKSTPEYDKRLQENKAKSDAKAEADYKKEWLKKTANSPAAKAGFSPEKRWELHVNNQKWRKSKGRNHEKLAIGSKKKEK